MGVFRLAAPPPEVPRALIRRHGYRASLRHLAPARGDNVPNLPALWPARAAAPREPSQPRAAAAASSAAPVPERACSAPHARRPQPAPPGLAMEQLIPPNAHEWQFGPLPLGAPLGAALGWRTDEALRTCAAPADAAAPEPLFSSPPVPHTPRAPDDAAAGARASVLSMQLTRRAHAGHAHALPADGALNPSGLGGFRACAGGCAGDSANGGHGPAGAEERPAAAKRARQAAQPVSSCALLGAAAGAAPPTMSAAQLEAALAQRWPEQAAVAVQLLLSDGTSSLSGARAGAPAAQPVGARLYGLSSADGAPMRVTLALSEDAVSGAPDARAAREAARAAWLLLREVLFTAGLLIVPNAQAVLGALSELSEAPLELTSVRMGRVLDPVILGWLLSPDDASDCVGALVERFAPSAQGAASTSSAAGRVCELEGAWRLCDCLYARLLAEHGGEGARALLNGLISREMAAVPTLARMERLGLPLDTAELASAAEAVDATMELHAEAARRLARKPDLNLASPQQLAVILWDEMRLPPPGSARRGAPARSTDEPTLRGLAQALRLRARALQARADGGAGAGGGAGEGDAAGVRERLAFVEAILAHRTVAKLKSTYLEPLISLQQSGAHADGAERAGGVRVRSRWAHHGTGTGRLASSQPNVQNIPREPYTLGAPPDEASETGSAEGGRVLSVRDAIRPHRSGGALLSADYAQLEVRLLALISRDGALCEQLRTPRADIFRSIGCAVLGKPAASLDEAERAMVKKLVYALIYGLGAERLAAELKVPPARAHQLKAALLARFGQLREFMEACKAAAKRNGFVRTLGGRRRPLPAIASAVGEERARAERQCVNSVVQGTAADIVKAAMVLAEAALQGAGLGGRVRLVAQIHDELLFELADAADVAAAAAVVRRAMEGVCLVGPPCLRLGAPLPVKLTCGSSWGCMQPVGGLDGAE